MDQVTHRPLAVQQRPRQLRKAFLPYVYISALSIFTPWENTQFSVPFVLKGVKASTSLHPNFETGPGQGGQVSFCAKSGHRTQFSTIIWFSIEFHHLLTPTATYRCWEWIDLSSASLIFTRTAYFQPCWREPNKMRIRLSYCVHYCIRNLVCASVCAWVCICVISLLWWGTMGNGRAQEPVN